MNISLEQAIEIHARALVQRHKGKAPSNARVYADRLNGHRDCDGCAVWLGVASAAERILDEKCAAEDLGAKQGEV
ncbi:hypothetical protein LG047_13245 [Methylocystis sp. WRRC1]|uniref:hypothetical protein n=1 Tax=Methylocystis sp. WRRC1 TaxID=1732014 RepID=UPI001D142AE1|nr:hypothetical protein [Methylocystis sp. WRRC1]MCC3246273.1 hypothetical protein [Methylocystis sp. WRRC1]